MQIAFPPEVELGAEYDGKVVNITKFGAFVNIISLAATGCSYLRLDGSKRVERVEDYLVDGQELKVRFARSIGARSASSWSRHWRARPFPSPRPRQDGGDAVVAMAEIVVDGGRDRGRVAIVIVTVESRSRPSPRTPSPPAGSDRVGVGAATCRPELRRGVRGDQRA